MKNTIAVIFFLAVLGVFIYWVYSMTHITMTGYKVKLIGSDTVYTMRNTYKVGDTISTTGGIKFEVIEKIK